MKNSSSLSPQCKWLKANPAKRKLVLKKYHQTDSYKNVKAKYRNSVKGRYTRLIRGYRNRREALGYEPQPVLTLNEYQTLIKENKCAYCKCADNITVDHKTPIKLGGSDEIDNLQLLCRSCNSSKRQRPHKEMLLLLNLQLES